MFRDFVFVILCLAFFANAARIPIHQSTNSKTCGYESCPVADPNKLNIHLVAHTHDDVGWLKTVDQYYFGSRTMIQKAGVQYILDSVISALKDHPDRKFIYVETAFLWKWWLRQNEDVRETVRTLINEGRLEIIGGGWSMNDEAVTHYHSMIDQYTWGFRRLNDTFGSCARPHIGWQIDPFGHSREQASMFAQMGFDGMLFGRLDYQDKEKRLQDKTAEFIWKGSPSLGDRANLFTTALYNAYSPPPGFCFDVLCADEPVIDDPESPDYNVDERIGSLLKYAEKQAQHYRTNNVILTMGGDFTYQHADMWYTNLDKIIRYTNERNGSSINVFYSTPSCYLKALNDKKITWPTKTDDFFPYASDPHSFWTGYYSSRPTIKFFEKMGNNFLQICKQLSVLTDQSKYEGFLEHFREAMGIMQHHDAVTGTEKQLVADDYARILHESIHHGEQIVADAYTKLSSKNQKNGEISATNSYSCLQLNISSCPHTEDNHEFAVTLYNPLSRPISTYVRLPVEGEVYLVKDHNGAEIVTQMVPIPSTVLGIPGRFSKATKELVFHATDIPPLGYRTFLVKEQQTSGQIREEDSSNTISNDVYNVSVNNEGHVVVQRKNQKTNYVQSFHYYEGAEGNNEVFANRSSGAYIFRPKQPVVQNFAYLGSSQVFKGPLVQEIHQTINQWVSQVVRIYKGEEHVEFDWLVGPIPVRDKIGKEIITSYTSNLESEGIFYTDSNGREMLKRTRNARPTWPIRLFETISGNYYPVPAKISLRDEKAGSRMTVLTDRSQGGSSLRDGQLELMLHRRLLKDDAFGVGEALNETAYGEGLVVRGQHFVLGGSVKDLDKFTLKEKELALSLSLRPWTLITPVQGVSFNEWKNANKMRSSALTKALPPNVNILTLEPWKDGSVLLRLEHIFEANEAPQLSQKVEINLQDLFTSFTVESAEETTLGGNQWIKDVDRLHWQQETNEVNKTNENNSEAVRFEKDGIKVVLKPMEIRTFIVKISPRL